MRTRFTAFLSLAAVALIASTAAAQGKTTTCMDGTMSAVVGRGACSGHGGVKKAEKRAAKRVKRAERWAAKAEKTADKTADKSEKKADKVVTKGIGAEVKCTDGSMSKPGRGACSH